MADPFLKSAYQSANDIPSMRPADFDIALAIDSDDRVIAHLRLLQMILIELVFVHGTAERGAGHFYEAHCSGSVLSGIHIAGRLILASISSRA
jgi:hypothetical protein